MIICKDKITSRFVITIGSTEQTTHIYKCTLKRFKRTTSSTIFFILGAKYTNAATFYLGEVNDIGLLVSEVLSSFFCISLSINASTFNI